MLQIETVQSRWSKTIKNKQLLQDDGSYMKAKDVNFDIKERNSRN